MGLVDNVRKQMAAAAAPASTPAAPAAAPQPVAPPPAPVVTLTRVVASLAVAGNLYLIPGGGVGRLEVVTPSAVFLSRADGSPARLAPTDEITDVSSDEVARKNFGLAPLPPAAAEKERKMRYIDEPAPGAGSAVAPPDQTTPARNPEELAARAGTTPPPPPVATAETPPAPDAPEKPKRGRPPGSGKKSAMATAEGVATGEASSALMTGLVLCVDCTPSKGASDLTAFVADLAAQVAHAAGLEDVRFAPKDNPLAFSAWRGALAAAAREAAPSGLCAIYSGELADPVIEALAGVATVVIRGRR